MADATPDDADRRAEAVLGDESLWCGDAARNLDPLCRAVAAAIREAVETAERQRDAAVADMAVWMDAAGRAGVFLPPAGFAAAKAVLGRAPVAAPPVATQPQQPPLGIPDELIRDVAREYGLALPADAGLMRRVDTQIPGGLVYRVPCECGPVAAAQIIRPDTPVTAAPFVSVDLAPYIWVTSHGQRWRARHGGCPNCRRVHWAATPD